MPEMLKPKDTVERSCSGCLRIHKCDPKILNKTKGTIERINPFVSKGFDIKGPNGAETKCSSDNLKKIEKESTPYWGISQNDPLKSTPRPKPKVEKPEPAIAAPIVDNFGYGPACSMCRATRGEDHSPSCQLEGSVRLDG